VDSILDYMVDNPGLIGCREPYYVFLTCYEVLSATKDPRAEAVLETGYHLLMDRAAMIEDEPIRRSFLENVAVNRKIVTTWDGLQRPQDD
jgi:hypothetical protein